MPTRQLSPETSVLMVVDIQDRFLPVILEAERLIEKARILIVIADRLNIPVIISEHYPKGLGNTQEYLTQNLPVSAKTFEKSAFGCLEDQAIREHLVSLERKQIIVCGLETHVCVSQTVHQLLEAGYQPHLVEDAVSSRELYNSQAGVQKMIQSGAIPCTVETVLFELLRTSAHPEFKSLQQLIK